MPSCSVQEEAFEAAALLIVLRLWRVIRIVNGKHTKSSPHKVGKDQQVNAVL